MEFNLPSCVRARHQQLDPEYYLSTERGALYWACNCGACMVVEYGDEPGHYTPIASNRKAEFLAQHTDCVAKCYCCGTADVPSLDHWCDECDRNRGEIFAARKAEKNRQRLVQTKKVYEW